MAQTPIDPSELRELLLSLQAGSRTGRLRLQRDGLHRELYVRSGALVAADSSSPSDALEWILFSSGAISEESHARVRSLIEGGERRGRALVESGCLTPASLCEWTERRVRILAADALSWDGAACEFEEGAAPQPGAIAVHVEPVDLLLEALRSSGDGPPAEGLPAAASIPEPAPGVAAAAGRLLPHERYVLSLADGRRPVSEICSLSEVGETEVLRVLSLLGRSGFLRTAAAQAAGAASAVEARGVASRPAAEPPLPADLPAGDTTLELRAIIRIYNEQFALAYGYMIKEVGPIAEQILEKHLRDPREAHLAVFGRCAAGRDGTLPEEGLIRNLNAMKSGSRRDALVAALSDHLACLRAAVRKVLGAAHAEALARRMREARCARA